MSEVERNHTAGSQGNLIYDCPNGEVCRSCPCSHEDDVCFPGERLRAEVQRLRYERSAVIDCVNLYGDTVLHEALTAAGLLLGASVSSGVSGDQP